MGRLFIFMRAFIFSLRYDNQLSRDIAKVVPPPHGNMMVGGHSKILNILEDLLDGFDQRL